MPITIGNIAFQAISLIVLGAFCWMIYAFRAQATECLKGVVKFSLRDGTDHVDNKQQYDSFLGVAMTLGAFSVALGIVKIAAWLLTAGTGTPGTIQWNLAGLAGTEGIAGVSLWILPIVVIAVAALATLVVLAEMGILRVAGAITFGEKFAEAIIQMKKNWLAALALFLTPLVAVWTGINPARDTVSAYILAIVTIALCSLFIIHTLRGFIKQKVSLLIWFLYLCTVEIFPVCAIVVTIAKFM
jgi:hypothetical protein